MKKSSGIIIVLLIVAVIGLSFGLYYTYEKLASTESDLEGMLFTEGKVIETKTGGIVTASLKSWVYFEDDSFVTSNPKTEGTSINGIFCDLHTTGFVDSMKGDLVKLKYTKQILVKSGETEKSYYLIGDYYITFGK